jgi:hypothetical protein
MRWQRNKGLYVVAWKTGRKDTTRKPGRYREIQYSFEKQSGRMSERLLDLTGSGQELVAACTEGFGFMDCRKCLDY